MDPFTQGVVGAFAAQSSAKRRLLAKAAVIGALGGMAPDLDVLISSSTDPLLFLEYHRHFTHSLFFIPIGGVLTGLVLFVVLGKWWQLTLQQCLLWSTLGYATHGLLDTCTSYGTQLLWPLKDYRYAWDVISVVDPLFTLPSAALLILAARSKRKRYLLIGIAWMATYISAAAVQHQRAIAMGHELAASRGHQTEQLSVKPSFGNIVVWKLIYENDGVFHVDALKPGVINKAVWAGESISRLDVTRDFPWLDSDSQQARDIERFAEFSAGYVALDPDNPNRIADIRYSLLPQNLEPLWGIELSRDAGTEQHVQYYTQRNGSREALPALLNMITKGEVW
jgi:inner membrane protein